MTELPSVVKLPVPQPAPTDPGVVNLLQTCLWCNERLVLLPNGRRVHRYNGFDYRRCTDRPNADPAPTDPLSVGERGLEGEVADYPATRAIVAADPALDMPGPDTTEGGR